MPIEVSANAPSVATTERAQTNQSTQQAREQSQAREANAAEPVESRQQAATSTANFENPQAATVARNDQVTQTQLSAEAQAPSRQTPQIDTAESQSDGELNASRSQAQEVREQIQGESTRALEAQANQRPEVVLSLLN